MRVNDFDVVFTHELADPLCAQNSERVPKGNVQYIFRRQKIEPRLPLVRRAQGGKNLVSVRLQTAQQINKMPLAAAENPRR